MPFPDVQLARRPLHFIYLCDCSGSMQAHGKMQALNQAIRQSLPGMEEVARENPEAQVLVRAVSFADQARWHIATPTPVAQVAGAWVDLEAGGLTAMGEALQLVAAALRSPPMERRALPPVLVLISDGAPTDDVEAGLRALNQEPWAAKAVRLAVAIGHDADQGTLRLFLGDDPVAEAAATTADGDRLPGRPAGRRPLLMAHDAATLARHIRWASTAVVGAVSQPVSQLGSAVGRGNVPLPELPETVLDPFDPNQVVW